MKLLISLLPLLFSSLSLAESHNRVIISDIDDTISITNVGNPVEAAFNLQFGKKTFLGMSELYQEMSTNASGVVYMSGSPRRWAQHIQNKLIQTNKFPVGSFFLRRWSSLHDLLDIYKFKSDRLVEIAKLEFHGKTDRPFVLLGDDTESDPQVYLNFKKHHLGRTEAIYIRSVKGKKLEGVTTFHTAFDIALNEVEARRLTAEQAIRVGSTILSKKSPDLLFPHFAICPLEFAYKLGVEASKSATLVQMSEHFSAYVRETCKARSDAKDKTSP